MEETSLLDKVFYSLCKKYPNHNNLAEVRAKLYVVGRGFATGIERHISVSEDKKGKIDLMAACLLDNHDEVDGLVAQVKGSKLDQEGLPNIVEIHSRFVELLKPLTGSRALTCFVSKYLHCHRPIVPIFDNVAKREITSKVRWKREYNDALPGIDWNQSDETYLDYVIRFWQVFQRLAEEGAKPLNPRLVDYFVSYFLRGLDVKF